MKKRTKIALAALSLGAMGSQPRLAGGAEAVGDGKMSSEAAMKATSNFNAGMIQDWPEKPRLLALALVAKYGPPAGVTSKMLVWHENAPWKRTIVYREEVEHLFPMKHTDFLEQTVAYHVPDDKAGDLAQFDGSVIVDRTKGEISARCDKEENNRLALNVADEIAQGKWTVADARAFFTKTVEMKMSGKSSEYMDTLLIKPQSAGPTMDPDAATIPGK